MHCPRCGQLQVSEDTRFCSRCGFLLELISEVLANGGILPQLAELNKKKKFFSRKNGLKLALIWTVFFWLLLTPLFGIAGAEEATAIPAVIGFFGGIFFMLISFLFLDDAPKSAGSQTTNFRSDFMPQNLSGNAQQNALPPQQSVPASSYVPPAEGKWRTTNDLVTPPSVTEPTTKLLQKDE
jgi:hypothetical protein